MTESLSRRAFLGGLIAAPAVIRVAPLMRIVPMLPILTPQQHFNQIYSAAIQKCMEDSILYGVGAIDTTAWPGIKAVPLEKILFPKEGDWF